MIPLRDDTPRVYFPLGVILLIVLNFVMHLYVTDSRPFVQEAIYRLLGVVPARYSHPEWARLAGYPAMGVLPFFSYMFLHSGWWHLIANMWMLWLFGDNIEDVMGTLRFLAFYLICGLAALGLHLYFNTEATTPIIGASGAIAGIMGAYVVLYPHGRVLTLIPIIVIPYFIWLPAWLFLGFWFCTQFFSGLSAQTTGIAWWAHVGGFAAGMLLIRLFMRPERCHYCQYKRGDFRFS